MIEFYLRTAYQTKLVDPLIDTLIHRITPNQLTVLSGIFGFFVLPALWYGLNMLGILLLLMSGYLDTVDGSLARKTAQMSDWGAVLDITMDRFVEFTVIFALWSIAPNERGIYCILMLGSILLCITSFLVVGIFTKNDSEKGFYYSPGIMERAEAFAFFIAMILWPKAFSFLALSFTALVLLTAVIRLKQFYNQSITQRL